MKLSNWFADVLLASWWAMFAFKTLHANLLLSFIFMFGLCYATSLWVIKRKEASK